jgi:RHS repeat-associated protein
MAVQPLGDGSQMVKYLETYTYDDAGNILSMRHESVEGAHIPGWTRHYTYAEPSRIQPGAISNRLSQTSVGGKTETYRYDGDCAESGCISSMPGPLALTWDVRNRLRSTSSQVVRKEGGRRPETTWYVYDAQGERVRKVTERCSSGDEGTTSMMRETLYMDGVDVHRKYAGDGRTVVKERTTHAIRGATRVAMAERARDLTKTGAEGEMGTPLMRYQTTNNLELDGEGLIVSYEEHTPYGSPTYTLRRAKTEASRRYRFAAYERDNETALDHCHARYYISWLGRWLSPDPIGLGDGPNVYCYVGDDPVNYHEPQGTDGKGIFGCFGGFKSKKVAPDEGVKGKSAEETQQERAGESRSQPPRGLPTPSRGRAQPGPQQGTVVE